MSENKKKTTNLDDMMDKKPRSGGISIDVTKGTIEDIPTNESQDSTETETEAPAVTKRAEVVSTGPVDMSNMQPIDMHNILPKRPQEPNPIESDLFANLDAAVEREKQSITDRVNEITAAQKREFEEANKAKEDSKQKEEDDFAVNASSNVEEDDDYGADYGTDDVDDDIENIISKNSANEESDGIDDVIDTAGPAGESTSSINVEDEEVKHEPEIIKPDPETKLESAEQNPSILDMVSDDSLFDDEEEEKEGNTDNGEELFETLKKEVKATITPIRKSLDLSKFTIAQKSVNAQKVMRLAIKNHQNISDWIMYSANRAISMTGLSGPEILKLNPENTTRNRLNTFRDMYRIIYDHVYDANKPEFETWLKQVRFVDLQHIYFGLYMATFDGSNFITYTCPECNKVFIKDIKFEDMVDYDSDEIRTKVEAMRKMDTTSQSSDTYPVDLEQISDNYVFALKTPSIWNVIIETASLSDNFIEKHADLIDIVSYIDAIYLIDAENQTLVPINTNPDPNDQAKTSARRIRAFYDIIRTLNSEDYYALRSKINEYDKSSSEVSYMIPACTCPQCAKEIPANKEIGPDNMLFTRHQLAAIGNM